MLKKILHSLEILLFVSSFFLAGVAYADSTTGSGLCAGDALSQLFCSTSISGMLNQLFQLSIALGGVLAIMRIGYAGYLYMGSADMWSNKQHAKEVFRDSIIGLLILLSIYLILFQINPDILSLRLLQDSGSTPSTTCVPGPGVSCA